jgi:hypothetical protein
MLVQGEFNSDSLWAERLCTSTYGEEAQKILIAGDPWSKVLRKKMEVVATIHERVSIS